MKVTFILPRYIWSGCGGPRVIYEYANHLAIRGHTVTVVHPNVWGSPSPRKPGFYGWARRKGAGLRDWLFTPSMHWQPIDPRVRMAYVPKLADKYVPDADAIFTTSWTTADFVLRCSWTKGAKFNLIQHFETTHGGTKEQIDALWRMPLHKVVIADWLYDLGTELGCQDMVKIPNGFDHSRFRISAPIAQRPERVAMMFAHAEWKGSADGLAALERVKARHPGLQAVFFGHPRRPGFLPSWIAYVRNPSEKQLVESVYNSARIFVCPSWTEGFPLPPGEAMACGCAVASTSCTGVTEYAEHNVTALLSPIKNPVALAANILRLFEDDELRIRIAEESHKRIQSFNWERSTDLLERYIQESVQQDTRSDRAFAVAGD
jgi:glycosyltransferase involved in cell wall biosynthesis